jgi:hypothetical protein
MNGFFVFAPSFLDQNEAKFVLSDRTIFLAGMYPLYNDEIDFYKQVGLERFWHAKEFDMYNVNRPEIRSA